MKPNRDFLSYKNIINIIISLLVIVIGTLFINYGQPPISSWQHLLALLGLLIPITLFILIRPRLFKKYKDIKSIIKKSYDTFNSDNQSNIIEGNSEDSKDEIDKYQKESKDQKLSQKIKKWWARIHDINYGIAILSVPRNQTIKFLGLILPTIWLWGWVLYYVAIWSDITHPHSISGMLLYSAMSSFDLFLVDVNGNILDNIIQQWPYSGILSALISFTAILASLSLFSILLSLFFNRLISYIHTKMIKITSKDNYHIFVFWGTGESERLLAKSILTNSNHRNEQNLVIFIDSDKRETEETDGWSNIVEHLTLSNPLASKVNHDIHTIYLVADRDISSIDSTALNVSDFWSELGLSRVNKIIEDISQNTPEEGNSNELHFFFLSNDRDKNVLASKILIDVLNRDRRLNDSICKKVYCVTRKDGVTAAIEEKNASKSNSIIVKVVDDANISIESLKRDINSYPIKFVDIDFKNKLGFSNSSFCSLIIGFGETGRDAFRYLYEYVAIPYNSGRHPCRLPFECHIIDKESDDIKGKFTANSPSIFNKNEHLSDANTIEFHNFKDSTKEFYELLDKIGPKLNYVVVCVGDDETNITTAVNLLKYVRKYKRQMDKFKIFVRTYEDNSFSHIESIAKYYNELYEYQVISIFGKKEDIFSYDSIIEDKIEELAGRFHNSYTLIAEPSGRPNWDDLKRMMNYNVYKELTPEHKQFKYPEAVFDVNRRINENRKNVFHTPHKIFIIQQFIRFIKNQYVKSDLDLQGLYSTMIGWGACWKDRFDYIKNQYNQPDDGTMEHQISTFIYNLCIFEHLRWNASHELIGFQTGDKDYIAKTHNCLKDWLDLDSYTPLYDYLVIEKCIEIHLEMIAKGEDLSL